MSNKLASSPAAATAEPASSMIESSQPPFPALPVTEPSLVPYTLRLGVTGHREFDHASGVAENVKNALTRIRAALAAAASGSPHPLALGQGTSQRLGNLLFWKGQRILSNIGVLPRRSS